MDKFCMSEDAGNKLIFEAAKKGIEVTGEKWWKALPGGAVELQCCRMETESIARLAKAMNVHRSKFRSCPEGHEMK